MIPVILSGGSGTRLWPLSRQAYPKQFLALAGEDTMLQATWQRVAELASAAPLVVANEDHRFMVAEQLRELGCTPAAIVLEPVGRNTAPAIAVAALQATADGTDPLLLVLPSDHVIADAAGFRAAVAAATPAAQAGKLVTFGIVPTAAETGYGYIKAASDESTPTTTAPQSRSAGKSIPSANTPPMTARPTVIFCTSGKNCARNATRASSSIFGDCSKNTASGSRSLSNAESLPRYACEGAKTR